MPIFVVGASSQRVQIPHQALTVSLTGTVSGAELEIRCGADQPVVRNSAHHAVLPRLIGPVLIAVRPVGSPRFGAATVIHLAIGQDNPDDLDPVEVIFDPVDVSGDTGVVFAELTPRGQLVEVTVSAVADTPLSPLAAAARTSARNAVGRGSSSGGGAVVLALDTSASMRSWFDDGTVAAVADIVEGVADAVGLRGASAVLVGSDLTPVSPVSTGGLAGAVRSVRPRWCAGVRWSRIPDGSARTVVCTDTVTEIARQRFPLIILSDDPRQERVGARLPSPPSQDATAALLAHPDMLDRVTATLTRALVARPQ